MTTAAGDGFRLAFSWLSVAPVTTHRVDEHTTRRAIALAPVVGVVLGSIAALVLATLHLLDLPELLSGLLTVGLLVLLTRGMHVDGLADAVDGLGCYGTSERALNVMRDGSTGPFAVVALFLVLAAQAVSLGTLADDGRWVFIAVAYAVGRAGFVLCCRRDVPAARPEGMGALVAGTQATWLVAAWWVVLAVLGTLGAGWRGVIAVAMAAVVLLGLLRHVRRRFGGITGDVLGAACEVGTTVALVVGALG